MLAWRPPPDDLHPLATTILARILLIRERDPNGAYSDGADVKSYGAPQNLLAAARGLKVWSEAFWR